jgi:TATA-binding protein-associated factor Taf7
MAPKAAPDHRSPFDPQNTEQVPQQEQVKEKEKEKEKEQEQEQEQEQEPAQEKEQEKEQDENATDARINVIIRDQRGSDVTLKVKRTTKVHKVINTYCKKRAVDPGLFKFLFDGQRVQVSDKQLTVGELGMEDSDVLDAVVEQVGG